MSGTIDPLLAGYFSIVDMYASSFAAHSELERFSDGNGAINAVELHRALGNGPWDSIQLETAK